MPHNQFKTPLLQSAGILAVVAIFIICLGASGTGVAGVSGFAQGILFLIGLAIGLTICIAVMIGIFFAAVSMADGNQAGQLWVALKNRCTSS